MATVIIRKHPTENRIEVDPEIAVLKPDEKLTFRVSSSNGFAPGTNVTVQFRKEYFTPKAERPRAASQCGPFARRAGEPRNPKQGTFVFDAPGDFETGVVKVRPRTVPHTWKYDVQWTGCELLDPMIKIEKGG